MSRTSRYHKPIQPPNLTPWWAIAFVCVLGGIAAILVGIALAIK
jgi:hypothetical protein